MALFAVYKIHQQIKMNFNASIITTIIITGSKAIGSNNLV